MGKSRMMKSPFADLTGISLLISYDDLAKNFKIQYVAGGAAQNAARGAQVSSPFSHLLFPPLYAFADLGLATVRSPRGLDCLSRSCRFRWTRRSIEGCQRQGRPPILLPSRR